MLKPSSRWAKLGSLASSVFSSKEKNEFLNKKGKEKKRKKIAPNEDLKIYVDEKTHSDFLASAFDTDGNIGQNRRGWIGWVDFVVIGTMKRRSRSGNLCSVLIPPQLRD